MNGVLSGNDDARVTGTPDDTEMILIDLRRGRRHPYSES